MIKISSVQVNDKASRVYGDFVEKTAFNVNVDPAMILGSLAGGYTANAVYNKKKDQYLQEQANQQRIENNSYSQIEALLNNLKIVFTPINVIYSVNGQVFEIISADEMTPHMRQAFIQKDAPYFRDLLMHKINMEIQLAEQAFAQRLLASSGYTPSTAKESNYVSKQAHFLQLEENEFQEMVKTASVGTEEVRLSISPNFDSLRPFYQTDFFFNPKELTKVASVFDLFSHENVEDIGLHRINSEINVGFLPDRVVYVWNGQLIEQMSLLQMNEKGFAAFQRKDKQFFIELFRDHSKALSKTLQQPLPESTPPPPTVQEEPEEEQKASEDDDVVGLLSRLEKTADALEDIVENLVEAEFPVMEREQLRYFTDPDIHPVAYDRIMTDKYGAKWPQYEMESLFKQIEIDFHLEESGISDNPLNKLMILHAVSHPDHAVYQAPLSFEKFVRGVNSKDIQFEEFQGNLAFEEIMFGLEVAKAYGGEEVYFEFHSDIAAYVAEELMNAGVRYVSTQLFDETNSAEKDFFDSVNGFLMRKWKEHDAQGVLEDEEIESIYTSSLQIIEIAEEILTKYAESISVDEPYESVDTIITEENLLDGVEADKRNGVKNMAQETVLAQFMTALFLEYKHQELEYIFSKLEEEGGVNG